MKRKRVESAAEDLSQLQRRIAALLQKQSLAVLSTQGAEGPYASLVAFAESPDLKHLLFATTRSTRKYKNLSRNPRAALLIDNRSNRVSDFVRAMAVTAIGEARELAGQEREAQCTLYLTKHPRLREFVSSPSCALFCVRVDTYLSVSRFQNVQELHIKA